MYDAIDSKYTYKNSDVLINKKGIKDEDNLKEYEVQCVAKNMEKILARKIPEYFTVGHFKKIHYDLFSDIYDFAGFFREENITKDNFLFSDFRYIDENIRKIFSKIDIDAFKKLPFDELIIKISEIMTDLNVLHPFREGNGRATRELIREILETLGYKIDFFNIDYDKIVDVSKKAVIDDKEQIELLNKNIIKK